MESNFDLGFDIGSVYADFDEEMDGFLADMDLTGVEMEHGDDQMPPPDVLVQPAPQASSLVPQPRHSAENNPGRFPKKSSEEISDLLDHKESKSTKNNTKWAIKTFMDWAIEQDNIDHLDMATVEPSTLADHLLQFYAEAQVQKKRDGSRKRPRKVSYSLEQSQKYDTIDPEYHRNTMKNLRSGINRFLRTDLSREIDIVRDKEFRKANDLLTGKMKKQLKDGKSPRTLHHPIIETGDIEKLRDSLSKMTHSPTNLLRKVWFEVSIHFISRGLELHPQLHTDSFEFCSDDGGREYATLKYDVLTKTTQGGLNDPEMHGDKRMYATNDEDCPVAALKHLISVSHPEAKALFCEPVTQSVHANIHTVWFTPVPVSKRVVPRCHATHEP